MVEPINLQIIVTNIDEVAKTKNVHEHSLLGQQLNAQKDQAKENERQANTVIEARHTEKKGIQTEKDEKRETEKRYLLRDKKEQKKDEKKEKHDKPKEPNKGGILDIEI